MWFLLLQSQVTTNWESFPWQERLCSFIILRSAYAAGWTWGVTLQPSDQIPSLADWEWKYSKDNMFAADWWRAYDVNLNEYIFTCTCKELCFWCKWKKYHVLHFAVASVLQHKKILLDSLFIHMQTRIYNPVKYVQWTLFCENSKEIKIVNYIFKKVWSEMFNWVWNTPLKWMYLVIFRCVSSACIYLNILCVIICQKIV